jgi:hypothetical protein
MDILSFDIKWLIIILLAANFLGIIVLVNREERFWLPAVFLWIFIFSSLVFFDSINDIILEKKEIIYYDQQPAGNEKDNTNTSEEIRDARKQAYREKTVLVRLAGVQTFFTFLCLVMGYKKTGKKQYRSGVIVFFLLIMVYIGAEIFILTRFIR